MARAKLFLWIVEDFKGKEGHRDEKKARGAIRPQAYKKRKLGILLCPTKGLKQHKKAIAQGGFLSS